jgi:hypothetical protein
MSDKLIDDLTNDLKPCCPSCPYDRSARVIMVAVILGAALLMTLGIRHDLPDALRSTIPYWKSGMFAFIGVGALLVATRLGLPGRPVGIIGPGLMIAGVTGLISFLAGMMIAAPDSMQFLNTLSMHNSLLCVASCVGLGLGVYAVGILILRRLAFMRPGLAGFFLGIASCALIAATYAWHCTQDHPVYVGLWYSLPVLITGAVGGILGQRLLRV